jgi:hypothetical protein
MLRKYGNFFEPNKDFYREETCVVTLIKRNRLTLPHNIVMFIVILSSTDFHY